MTVRLIRRRIAAALVVGAALALAGCSSAPERGGASTLPTEAPPAASLTPIEDAVAAPMSSGTLIDGTTIALGELWSERPVVLQFSTSWCTQCAAAEEDLSAIAEDYGSSALVVHINGKEDAEAVASYLNDNTVAGPVLLDTDGSIWRAYAVTEPPLTAVIDSDGGIVRMWPGGATGEQIRTELDRVVSTK